MSWYAITTFIDNLENDINPEFLKNLGNINAVLQYKESKIRELLLNNLGLKLINSGQQRSVYQINKDTVIKVAFNVKGLKNNLSEAEKSKCDSQSRFITKIYDVHPEGLWIVAESLNSNPNDVDSWFLDHFDHMADDVFNFLAKKQFKYLQQVANDDKSLEWMYGLESFIKQCNIDTSDLHKENWGIREKTNEIVILDFADNIKNLNELKYSDLICSCK